MEKQKAQPHKFWTIIDGKAVPVSPPPATRPPINWAAKRRASRQAVQVEQALTTLGPSAGIFRNVVSEGCEGDAFVFQGGEVLGINLTARDFGGRGILAENAHVELINPKVE